MNKILSICALVFAVSTFTAQFDPEPILSQNCGITIADVDVSATGALIFSGDDVSGPVTLPFPFTFPGGLPVTDIVAASNGYLTTDLADTGPDLSNDCPLPATPSTPAGTMGERIYGIHDDLITDAWGEAATLPNPSGGTSDAYVIYYEGSHFGGLAGVSFAFVLWADNSFAVVYGGDPEDGSGSTSGFQNGDFSLGETFYCDTPGQGLGTTLTSNCVAYPPADVVPTMGEWGVICLMILMMIVTVVAVRREDLVPAYAE